MIRNRSVPSATIIPVLAYLDVVEAAEWMCRAFGFKVRLRIADHRVQLVYRDCAVILTTTGAVAGSPGTAHYVHVSVENADRHHDQALAAGARIVHPPTDHPYGERQYTAEDLAGHRWTFSESIADVDPTWWGGTPVDLD